MYETQKDTIVTEKKNTNLIVHHTALIDMCKGKISGGGGGGGILPGIPLPPPPEIYILLRIGMETLIGWPELQIFN